MCVIHQVCKSFDNIRPWFVLSLFSLSLSICSCNHSTFLTCPNLSQNLQNFLSCTKHAIVKNFENVKKKSFHLSKNDENYDGASKATRFNPKIIFRFFRERRKRNKRWQPMSTLYAAFVHAAVHADGLPLFNKGCRCSCRHTHDGYLYSSHVQRHMTWTMVVAAATSV